VSLELNNKVIILNFSQFLGNLGKSTWTSNSEDMGHGLRWGLFLVISSCIKSVSEKYLS